MTEPRLITDEDASRLYRAMLNMPYAGSIGQPGHPDRVTASSVAQWLDDLTIELRRLSDRVAVLTHDRDVLLRQRTAMREFLGISETSDTDTHQKENR